MKTPPVFSFRRWIALAATACVLAAPMAVSAKDRHHQHSSHGHHGGYSRTSYRSYPSSSFVLSLGSGYAGRGYYYGPPGADYYYERPEVRYYVNRPTNYGGGYSTGYSSGASVQRALARRGYYYGPIDGSIGPMSRRAIANYQAQHGMRPSGAITSSLMASLGL